MRPGHQVWLQEVTLVSLFQAKCSLLFVAVSYGVFELQFALKEPTRCYCPQHTAPRITGEQIPWMKSIDSYY